jgi:hypothetical protein
LKSSITVNGQPLKTIEKVVDMLYKVRSNFAHEIENSAEVSGGFVIAKDGNKRIVWENMNISLIQEAFEQGLLAHFNS